MIKEQLKQYAADAGIEVTEEQLQKFEVYNHLLLEWNEKINLTAITETKQVVIKHFLDSILLLQKLELQEGAKLVDVGTGAGFPGVPCAILREDLKITLLDSLNKRLIFLKELSEELHLPFELVHLRAEEGGHKESYRERYDLATARAVAHLRELSEYCLPLVRVGGYFAAMKGPGMAEELDESAKAIVEMGGKLRNVMDYNLPDGSRRSLILIEKISHTPSKYPRPSAKIAKFPL